LTAYDSDAAARPGFVRRLFDDTASDYDRINAVFSFGTGRRYRRQALLRAGLRPGDRVMDVATGTGLVAAEARRLVGAAGLVAALDLSWGMLQQARAVPGLGLIQGSMDALPFASGFASLPCRK
jgi:demethylmenaquinone methyltransferase/2-methoxy-6-polyprenyl-1,4-benzoquinol methylase